MDHHIYNGENTISTVPWLEVENNAWTSSDLTNYWITLPAEHLELGFWLESDRMEELSITEESLETQKSVVVAEKRQTVDNVPYGNAGEVMRRLMFLPEHPYGHEPIGKVEDIKKATLDGLHQFFHQHYVPENAILVIAGDLLPEKTLDMAEQYFGGIQRSSSTVNSQVASPHLLSVSGKRQHIVEPLTPLNATFIGWHVPGAKSDDLQALELLAMILADGDSSRFRLALEYDPLIASETSAFIDEGELSSIFCVYAIAQNNTIASAHLETKLLEEIKKIVHKGITDRELTRVKNRKSTSIAHSLLSVSERAERIAWNAALFNDPSLAWNEAELYEKITADEIITAAENYLCSTEPTVVEYGATDTESRRETHYC